MLSKGSKKFLKIIKKIEKLLIYIQEKIKNRIKKHKK